MTAELAIVGTVTHLQAERHIAGLPYQWSVYVAGRDLDGTGPIAWNHCAAYPDREQAESKAKDLAGKGFAAAFMYS